MHLTRFSDIGLRLMMYLAKEHRTSPAITVAEVAEQFNVPRNHLVKIAGVLARHGWITASRGRNGGISLAAAANRVSIGQILRVLEGEDEIIQCESLECSLSPSCELRRILKKAQSAFYSELDQYTLADISGGSTGQQIVNMHQLFLSKHASTSIN